MFNLIRRRLLSSAPGVRSKLEDESAFRPNLFNPTPEHYQLRQTVKEFALKELAAGAADRDSQENLDVKLFKKCGELGLFGVTVPEEYGGSGLDAVAACIIHEELGAVDQGFCLSYLAHSMLFANNLARNGNDHQKKEFLPKACSGEYIGGMGMSEPEVGTDVLGMQTSARKDNEGRWILNGRKFWITNGCLDDQKTAGDSFLIYAKTGKSNKDVSLFVLDTHKVSGFSVGQKITRKCGMRASPTAELVFDNVLLPSSALVGDENQAVICMMRNLEIERITLAAMSTGLARTCLQTMNQYATDRIAFKKPLREFGQIQKHLSESYAKYLAGRTYMYDVASRMNLDREGQRLDTDGVKLFCTTMGKEVADSAIQVLGGSGYVADYPVERLWRDSKLLEIGGGTLESHQKNMARELVNYQFE